MLCVMFEEIIFSFNDLVLLIFVEEEIDDYKVVEVMSGVMCILEKYLVCEIECIVNVGICFVMIFGIFYYIDEIGSDVWWEDGLVVCMLCICK